MQNRKLRIAWFAPLNVEQATSSVGAYCSDLLLPLLKDRFEIDLFHNQFKQYKSYPTYHYLSAFQRHQTKPYDIFFYQLEDKKFCDFIRVQLGLIPGLVWFHDFIFTSFGPEPILNSPWSQVVEIYNERSSAWPESGQELPQKGPLGYREGALAPVAAFSNPTAHSEYRRAIIDSLGSNIEAQRSFFLPIPAAQGVTSVNSTGSKGPASITVGFCGSPRIEHRAHKVLQALVQFNPDVSLAWLIDGSERDPARELIAEFGLGNVEIIEGRTPERWTDLCSKLEIAVHAFYSVYGSCEPYLSISLANGLPCIVTRFGAIEYIPSQAVFAVDAGESEATQICEVLKSLEANQSLRENSFGAQYIQECASPEFVANELAALFRKSAPFLKQVEQRWSEIARDARNSLLAQSRQFAPESWEQLLEPAFREFGWGTYSSTKRMAP